VPKIGPRGRLGEPAFYLVVAVLFFGICNAISHWIKHGTLYDVIAVQQLLMGIDHLDSPKVLFIPWPTNGVLRALGT
jgi:hypothetical protein